MERLSYQFTEWIRIRLFADRDERTETVHWNRAFLFNSVAALDVLLFSSLKQIGSGSDTNPHGYPHFCFVRRSGGECPWSGLRTYEIGTAGTNLGESVALFAESVELRWILFALEGRASPN
jgi:hypothetical protein